MDWLPTSADAYVSSAFKVARIDSLPVLESGSYWPKLRPYFLRPEYQRIRYSILGKSAAKPEGTQAISLRGASKAGELEVAFVADHLAAQMSITGDGLQGYCLTRVGRGQLTFSSQGRGRHEVNPAIGLIYRGQPDTTLVSNGPQDRVAIWIPHASIKQRLAACLGSAVSKDVEFDPVFQWNAHSSAKLSHLFNLLMTELQSRQPMILGSPLADRAFCDLLIYTLLHSLSHNHSDEIRQERTAVTPRILRQAEDYIRTHIEEPITLHEVAAAAGCSIRCLQLAFRRFKSTTPLLAIRQFRLEEARKVLHEGDLAVSLTAVAHRFGFTNLGRFKRLYETAFGESPASVRSRRLR